MLPTGTYEYVVELKMGYSQLGATTRTIRGTAEYINRVHADFGNADFGNRFTLDSLDRLYFSNGISLPGSGGSSSGPVKYTSPLVKLGANPVSSGITVVNGDNTSTFVRSYLCGFTDEKSRFAMDDRNEIVNRAAWIWNDGQGSYIATGKPVPGNSADPSIKWKFDDLAPNVPVFLTFQWSPGLDRSSSVALKVERARSIVGGELTNTYLVDQRKTGIVTLGPFVTNDNGELHLTVAADSGVTSASLATVHEVSLHDGPYESQSGVHNFWYHKIF